MGLDLGLGGAVGAVEHLGRQPGHAAGARRLVIRQQELVQGMVVVPARGIGLLAAASGGDQPEVLAMQGGAAGPIGPAQAQHVVEPELLQGRHAVPVDRVQHDHQPGLLQRTLFGVDVDVEVRVEAVQVAQLDTFRRRGGSQGVEQGARHL